MDRNLIGGHAYLGRGRNRPNMSRSCGLGMGYSGKLLIGQLLRVRVFRRSPQMGLYFCYAFRSSEGPTDPYQVRTSNPFLSCFELIMVMFSTILIQSSIKGLHPLLTSPTPALHSAWYFHLTKRHSLGSGGLGGGCAVRGIFRSRKERKAYLVHWIGGEVWFLPISPQKGPDIWAVERWSPLENLENADWLSLHRFSGGVGFPQMNHQH